MFKLTKARALEIQKEHVEHYVSIYGEHVRMLVADADRSSLLPDGEYDVVEINRYIPRGGAIEHLIPEHRANEERIKAIHDRNMAEERRLDPRRRGIYVSGA